jgi:hypothetical protein
MQAHFEELTDNVTQDYADCEYKRPVKLQKPILFFKLYAYFAYPNNCSQSNKENVQSQTHSN